LANILEGLKVVEVGHVVAVPTAASMLGDCGADVIKVEALTGDQSRKFRGSEMNPGFYMHNRSKRGIAVDLKQEAGQEIVHKLASKSDIFLTNYLQRSLEKLKMDYETISKIKSDIVYGIVTAYGSKGPDKEMPGYDFAAGWARSGIQYMLTTPGTIPPASRPGIIDRVSSLQIFGGIMAAMYNKAITGKGQKVEFNLYHTGVWMVGADIMDALVGVPLRVVDPKKSANPFYDVYKTKDERWLQLTAADRYAQASDPTGSAFWTAFCRAIDRPDLLEDPRFTTTALRQEHRQELMPIMEKVFASKAYADWEKRLRENELKYGPILSPTDVITDPQALANDFFTEVDHPDIGRVKLINNPNYFYPDAASIKSPAPLLGQHNEEVLSGLGYSTNEISQLRNDKVIL
jgi:crotonobetainyl-CoA:carnitine CoA-transferase CaiB-like acyl-CoA transferase